MASRHEIRQDELRARRELPGIVEDAAELLEAVVDASEEPHNPRELREQRKARQDCTERAQALLDRIRALQGTEGGQRVFRKARKAMRRRGPRDPSAEVADTQAPAHVGEPGMDPETEEQLNG